MTTTKPLSPAAQAVIDSVFEYWPGGHNHPGKSLCIAAALRVLVKNHGTPTRGGAVILSGEDVLAIAAELEEGP